VAVRHGVRLGLDREFITAMPPAGGYPGRARRSFPDKVARALADEANLAGSPPTTITRENAGRVGAACV
jgi:hypothetical protein